MEKFTREMCIRLLADKTASLVASGETRYPTKSDFTEEEAAAVKSFLGPWPRALEAAGVKEKRSDGHDERVAEKRIRQARRRRENKSKNK